MSDNEIISKDDCTISIPVTKDFGLKAITALEEELQGQGCWFDMSLFKVAGKATRDWELDYSLEGPLNATQIIELLLSKGIKFEVYYGEDTISSDAS